MRKVTIHFVCRGNIYRSRLAEAYLKSFQHPKWDITSSGIGAEKHRTMHTSPWAVKVAAKNNLSQWLTGTNKQTTQEDLDDSDLIVFMNQDVYRDARRTYMLHRDKCLVWRVKDRGDWPTEMPVKEKQRGTFRQIKRRVDKLAKAMVAGGDWVDIFDEDNRPRGFKLPIAIANQKSLWHRGCHVVITTPGNKTFVQQRSKSIVFSPGLVDITLGGHVDTGEMPEETAIREIKEEMGLSVEVDDLKLLDMYKWNRYHPRYRTHSKSFIYAYHVRLKGEDPVVVFQQREVQAVRLLSPSQLRRLLRVHRLIGGMRLNYSYAYYSKMIRLIAMWHDSRPTVF